MFEEQFELDDCEVIEETERRILVDCPDFDEPLWVPKSAILDDSEVWELSLDGSGPGTLVVSYDWADEQGWT